MGTKLTVLVYIMSATVSSAVAKRSLSKIVGIAILSLIVLVVLAYCIVTSSSFLRRFVLPKIGTAIHASITADGIRLSPFSSLEIENLQVTTTPPTPLLQVKSLRATYSLRDILRGRLTIDTLAIENGVLDLQGTSSGGSNLDPILAAGSTASSKNPSAAPRPLDLNISSISLKNCSVRRSQADARGGLETFSASNVVMSIASLVTGKAATISLASDLVFERTQDGKSTGRIQSAVRSDGKLTLNADGFPDEVEVLVNAPISAATGAFAAANELTPSLKIALSATECRELLLQMTQTGKPPTSFRVQGPLNVRKLEGQLKWTLEGVGRSVLNSLAARAGIDVGPATLSAHGELSLAKAGQAIGWSLNALAQELSVSREGKSTPPLRIELSTTGRSDFAAKTAHIELLQIHANAAGRPLLQSTLSAPMDLSWGTGDVTAPDAILELSLLNLALPEWRAWLGDWAQTGLAKAQLRITAKQGGKDLLIEHQVEGSDLTLPFGAAPTQPASVQFSARLRVVNWSRVALEAGQAMLSRSGQPALQSQLAGTFDNATGTFDVKSSVVLSPALWSEFAPPEPLSLSAGLAGRWEKVRKLTVSDAFVLLPSTPRAVTNQVHVSGGIDLTSADAITGAWTVKSAALDVTRLFETFRGNREAEVSADTNAPITFPSVEPVPSPSSLKSMRCELSVAQFFCGEIAMRALLAEASIENGAAQLKSLRCEVGEGKFDASATARTGTTPMTYHVRWTADRIPVEGFVNTFNPSMRGLVKGNIVSTADIKGSGVTGENLRKTLVGRASLQLTNATVLIPNTGKKVWILPLDVNRIASLLRLKELTQSPIHLVRLDAVAEQGRIRLENTMIRSDAFLATATGGLEIVSDLGQSSLNVPIDIALSRELSRRVKLFSFTQSSEEAYSKLPSFVSLGGTLSKLETKTDTAKILGMTATAAVGLAGGTATDIVGTAGKTVGKAIEGLGNLLGGKRSDTNNLPTTNAPAKNLNPLNLFKKKP